MGNTLISSKYYKSSRQQHEFPVIKTETHDAKGEKDDFISIPVNQTVNQVDQTVRDIILEKQRKKFGPWLQKIISSDVFQKTLQQYAFYYSDQLYAFHRINVVKIPENACNQDLKDWILSGDYKNIDGFDWLHIIDFEVWKLMPLQYSIKYRLNKTFALQYKNKIQQKLNQHFQKYLFETKKAVLKHLLQHCTVTVKDFLQKFKTQHDILYITNQQIESMLRDWNQLQQNNDVRVVFPVYSKTFAYRRSDFSNLIEPQNQHLQWTIVSGPLYKQIRQRQTIYFVEWLNITDLSFEEMYVNQSKVIQCKNNTPIKKEGYEHVFVEFEILAEWAKSGIDRSQLPKKIDWIKIKVQEAKDPDDFAQITFSIRPAIKQAYENKKKKLLEKYLPQYLNEQVDDILSRMQKQAQLHCMMDLTDFKACHKILCIQLHQIEDILNTFNEQNKTKFKLTFYYTRGIQWTLLS